MFLAFLIGHSLSAGAIMQSALKKLEQADSLSVTVLQTMEEFPKQTRVRYWFRKGGYFRAVSGSVVVVRNPKGGWTYQPSKKQYEKRSPLPPKFSRLRAIGLDVLSAGWPTVGKPRELVWHGLKTVRIELNGKAHLTKEAKFFLFFDPKTDLPLGISANLGSITQVRIFEHLELNPKLPASVFQFAPRKGWKQAPLTQPNT